MKSLVVLVILASISFSEAFVSCYFNSWANGRAGKGHFVPEDIDPFLCDEVIYSFAGINEETSEIMVLDPYNDLYDNYGNGGYDRLTNLKYQNPDLKTTLSVGGWNEGSEKFSAMAGNSQRRTVFITSAVDLLVQHNFDGIDIDWEFPTLRGGGSDDKANFVLLLQELRAALDQVGMSLTVAVSANADVIDDAYDVSSINGIVDRIHVMTYDFHGDWEKFTHHHAPLYAHPMDNADNSSLNVDYAVTYWLSNGASASKLIMGISTYARCYTLEAQTETGFYAPAPSPGRPGPYTGEIGILGYNEICEFESTVNDWIIENDPAMNEPYTFRLVTMIWCGFDNPTSAATKTAYAQSKGLGGIMIESLDTDDFNGICSDTPYGIVNSVVDTLGGSTQPTTVQPTQDPAPTTTDPALPPEPECNVSGTYYVASTQCDKFWLCSNGTPYLNECPEGKYWNDDTQACDDPANVDTSECTEPATV